MGQMPRSRTPAEAAIALAMDMVAVVGGLGVAGRLRQGLKVNGLRGTPRLQDGIEPLPRPLQQAAEPMDGEPRQEMEAGCCRRPGTAAGGPAGPGALSAALAGRASRARQRVWPRCAWSDDVDGSSANLTSGPGAGPGGWAGGRSRCATPPILCSAWLPLRRYKTLHDVVHRPSVGEKTDAATRRFALTISSRLNDALA
jgi:hypothetical protein